MIKKVLKLFLFIVSIAFAAPVFSQIAFCRFSIENGLPETRVNFISQDSTGFIWLAGENNLFRFDGHQFIAYQNTTKNSSAHPFERIRALFTDSHGTLWVGLNKGIAYYDFFRDRFVSPMEGWADEWVTDIAGDKNGNLWVSTGVGLAKFDTETQQTTWFTDPASVKTTGNNILPPGYINKLTTQPDGKIWLSTNLKGLYRFDPITRKIENFGTVNGIDFEKIDVSTIYFTNGHLFIGTFSGGFFWFNPEEKKVHNEVFDHLAYTIQHFQVSNDSIVWLAANNGLFRFNYQAGGYQRFTNIPNDPLSLDRTVVTHVFLDKENNLWTSSGITGINYGVTNVPFSHLNVAEKGAYQLNHKEVTSIHFGQTGNMWLGYESGLVEKHSSAPLAKTSYIIASKSRGGSPGSIFTLFEDSRNRIWLGGWMSGLQKLNPAGTAFEFATVFPESVAQLVATADIRGITEDRKGNLWISFHGIGIGRYNPASHFLELFRHDPENPLTNLSNDYTYNLCNDNDNNLWIATAYGVTRLNLQNKQFTNYFYEEGNPNSLSNNTINTVYCDHAGVVWAGASNGLNVYNTKLQTFQPAFTNQDFPFLSISAIRSVKPNEIWASTESGIFRFTYSWNANNDSLQINSRYFNRSDGLLSTNYFKLSSATSTDGIIYFGGNEGIDFFNPDNILSQRQKSPKPLLTGMEVDGLSVFHELKMNKQGIPELEFGYPSRMINIRYTSLHFNNQGRQKFRYRLKGFDDRWIYPINDQLATFTNLHPGDYAFQLEVQENNGDWGQTSASIQLTIKPPFWLTFPFIAFAIFVLVASIYLILRARSRTLLQRQKELERIIDIRTEELRNKNEELEKSNHTKNKFFSIISHDLRSPFSGLLGILELLSETEEVPVEMHNNLLKSAYKTANNTFKLLENLLTWASTQMNKVTFEPTSFNLSELIHKNIQLNKEQAMQKGIQIFEDLPEYFDVFGDLQMIDTVIRNILTNAIKFTHAGGEIKLSAMVKDNEVIVSIADSGIGLTPAQIDKLFDVEVTRRNGTSGEKGTGLGLVICQEFINKNNGKIWATQNHPNGTIFHFTLPVKNK
jgi:signal transduction histidine kinase/ligand-binding sensor domain-containing protein